MRRGGAGDFIGEEIERNRWNCGTPVRDQNHDRDGLWPELSDDRWGPAVRKK
jgi:hypothetical protein